MPRAAEGALEHGGRPLVTRGRRREDRGRAAYEGAEQRGLASARDREVEEEEGEAHVGRGRGAGGALAGGREDRRPVGKPCPVELGLDARCERGEIGAAVRKAAERLRADAVHPELLERAGDGGREARPLRHGNEVGERTLGKQEVDGARRHRGEREPARGSPAGAGEDRGGEAGGETVECQARRAEAGGSAG